MQRVTKHAKGDQGKDKHPCALQGIIKQEGKVR